MSLGAKIENSGQKVMPKLRIIAGLSLPNQQNDVTLCIKKRINFNQKYGFIGFFRLRS